MVDAPTIEFLHTAEVHVETFDELLSRRQTTVRLHHEVRTDWLDRAREGGLTSELRAEVALHLHEAARRSSVVVCTCSTLGPIADDVGEEKAAVFRIDRPMMERAARIDGPCLVAVCLESTIEPTSHLLVDAYQQVGRTPDYEIVRCLDAWRHFEAGDAAQFAGTIAAGVRGSVSHATPPGCVVLAQASMACAETALSGLGVPALSSPRMAAEEALRRVAAR